MQTKYLVYSAAAFIPLIIGYIWYHPSVFGSAIKTANGSDTNTKGHAPWVYLLAIVCSYFIARSLGSIVIHQYGMLSMLADQPDLHIAGTPLNIVIQGLLDKYGDHFRSFKHGALHGALTGVYLVLPILAVIAIFEKKRWTWLAIHAGYWILCLALMGAIVCAYMPMQIQLVK